MVYVAENWKGGSTNTVPFGLKDGLLWFVTDVESGLECGCRCPDPNCDIPLIARNRPSPDRKRAYHFMHSTRTTSCGGRESAVHRMAKELLLRAKTLSLPAWSDSHVSIPATQLKLAGESGLEVRILEGQLRPDVQVSGVLEVTSLPQLFVEIKVTHAVDWMKAAVAQTNGLSMIEIDLTDVTDEQAKDSESFEQIVLHGPENRTWVNLADPGYMAACLEQDVIEVSAIETFRHEVPTKSGSTMYFTKQLATLHRPGGQARPIDFELADYVLDGKRIDGQGNNLPYAPGLYVRNYVPSRSPWDISSHFKTYLRPLKAAREKVQPGLFEPNEG